MSTFQRFLVAGILTGEALLPAVAQAAVSYSYVTSFDGGTTFSSQDNVSAGSAITVSVYLQETLTSGSQSVVANDGGMYSVGFLSTLTAGDATINATGSAKNTSFTGNSGFASNNSTTVFGEVENQGNNFTDGISLDAQGRLFLGSFAVAAGTDNSTFTLAGYHIAASSPIGGNLLTINDAFDLDFNSGAGGNPSTPAFTGTSPVSFSINVPSAVPEPASLSLLACGALALLARRRRKP